MARFRVSLLCIGLALAVGACPDSGASAPKASCQKAYDKCTLASGVLGVCDVVDCPADRAPPCLVCRSQH
ncbi:MAG TPA: hypothetical protein VJR89_16275 [Polyangiales bacterium]|nr:hypothetical protein [Polyangiales bacterium]